MLPPMHSLSSARIIARFHVAAGVLFCLLNLLLNAQTSTGELSITVFDISGAVVPKATVVVTGSNTGNTLRTLVSNELGLAEVPLIPPGDYDVTVSAPGFKTSVEKKIAV